MTKLKMIPGIEANAPAIEARCISFVTDSGQTMFEVRPGADGLSIEVRAVDTCNVDGVFFGSRIYVIPQVSNGITVAVMPFEGSLPQSFRKNSATQ